MKQYCLTRQTLVFGTWNNIVWRPKQYCFVRESQIFGEGNAKSASFIRWKGRCVNKSEAFIKRGSGSGKHPLGKALCWEASCMTASGSNGRQCVFCESPENATKSTNSYFGASMDTVETFVWHFVNRRKSDVRLTHQKRQTPKKNGNVSPFPLSCWRELIVNPPPMRQKL